MEFDLALTDIAKKDTIDSSNEKGADFGLALKKQMGKIDLT